MRNILMSNLVKSGLKIRSRPMEESMFCDENGKPFPRTNKFDMELYNKELKKQARERAEKLKENQTLGVYDNEEDLASDMSWNDGEVSGHEEGFIDGAKWGMEHAIEWHDLRKDPTDLPKETGKYLTDDGSVYIYETEHKHWRVPMCRACWDFDWLDDGDVIAWCELPTYKA